ncbi:hypothetical protein [Clostridium estertheticum]|uniref:hypothetical protein n=1 Tax=Clostridium estertheticum TaxID=238834 RepID=UPI001C7D376F|nr:hypothetical protein [Clostridium estertheticum]MBX4267176.1 hypothetical protein [Clostridium estertheticum]WLC91299.1 hypothetical protein KTC95_24145 [Clostridium estertheticum]
MKYPFSRDEFLNVQTMLYDAIQKILDENIITNVNFKIERDLFYVPDENISKERLYTCNIKEWLYEIKCLEDTIFEELLFCLAYDRIYDNSNDSLRGTIKFNYRQHYLRLATYDLFSFREKLAFLIRELFDRRIKVRSKNNPPKQRDISFEKINNGLKTLDIFEENITWINYDEFKLIKDIMDKFKEDDHVKISKNVRDSFTHRSNAGIDNVPLISFERVFEKVDYDKVDDSLKKYIFKNTKNEIGINFISHKPLTNDKQFKYEDIIEEVLETWKLFSQGFEKLLKNVTILKKQVEL